MHPTTPLYALLILLVGSALGVVALLDRSPRARRFLDLSPWFFTEREGRRNDAAPAAAGPIDAPDGSPLQDHGDASRGRDRAS